jgi:hypothetical protein
MIPLNPEFLGCAVPGRVCGCRTALPLPLDPPLGTGIGIRKDRVMAAHDTPEYSVAEGNDYAAHEQTYLGFLTLLKWVIGIVILILIGMAYFLV